MKSYKKALVASLATVGVSCVLIGGATFALFSSDSTTDIAVTSGKVNVTAEVGDPALYTELYGEKTDMTATQWTNGGTVAVEGGEVIIENITPGDGVKLPVTIKNGSSVNVKYQIRLSGADVSDSVDSLLDVLDISVDSDLEMLTVGSTVMTSWAPLAVGSDGITLNLDIYFPEDIEEDKYQGLTCKYTLGVYAVQGNAQTSGFEGDTYYVTNADALEEVKALINAGATDLNIELMNDINLSEVEWTSISNDFQGTFNGNGHSILNLHGEGGLFKYLDTGAVVKDLVIEDANIVSSTNATGILADRAYEFVNIENVIVSGNVSGAGYYTGGLIGAVTSWGVPDAVAYITGCVNNATVHNSGSQTGGIVGTAYANVIFINCENNGDITEVGGSGVGGICGFISGYSSHGTIAPTFISCVNNGDITGGGRVGGIAGTLGIEGGMGRYDLTATFIGCSNSGTIVGTSTHDICGSKWNMPGGTDDNLTINIVEVEGNIAVVGQDDIREALLNDEVDYIVATEDIDLTELNTTTIYIGEGKTLDLNGNAIIKPRSSGGNHVYFSGINGTVKNGTIAFTGEYTSTVALSRIDNGANATFENVNFETNKMSGNGIVVYNAHATFTGCTFKNVQINIGGDESNVEFTDCQFTTDHKDGNGRSFISGLSSSSKGSLELTDCTFECTGEYKTNIIGITGTTVGANFTVIANNVTYTGNMGDYSGTITNIEGSFEKV